MKTLAQEEQTKLVYQNRRYVGSKETVAYVLFDVSKSFNINLYSERFIFDVLQIDFYYLAIVNFINTIWDVVNDTFTGVIVDKTRTRWGKFRPYLLFLAVPGTIGTCLYWMMPLFFPNTGGMHFGKFLAWLLLALAREGGDTFRGVATSGMLATITPHPVDRTRLITKANFFSGFIEKLPEILMGLFIDLINHNVVHVHLKTAYISMGLFTTIVSGAMAFYFFFITRERVLQSVEAPKIMEGFKSIINNKPILLITLSEFLGAFSISAGMNNYLIDVLGSASIKNIVGIPGGFVSNASYAYVPWMRRKFSTKALWLIGGNFHDLLNTGVFLLGSIGGVGPKGWYNHPKYMIPVLMAKETIEMSVYGIRKVIPAEMYNEAMDYCEWKNGFRTEGMTSMAKGLATKLVGTVSGTIKPIIMKKIGYEQGRAVGTQSDRTKYALFAMTTIIPIITGLLGIVPKFFYDLTGEKREKMYEELLARREETQKQLSNGHTDIGEAVSES
ncbi:MAG TPA: MFS transporter [Clostridiales bacterium]|jgi:GPH family glycoside/pentoside/hexuronide:cation symporter|nr:MFS transporter [Clostridiales bacterium]